MLEDSETVGCPITDPDDRPRGYCTGEVGSLDSGKIARVRSQSANQVSSTVWAATAIMAASASSASGGSGRVKRRIRELNATCLGEDFGLYSGYLLSQP